MKEPIGKIILGKRMIGWTDNVNGIILTIRQPEAFVYEGQNLTLINKAHKEGKIEFIKF